MVEGTYPTKHRNERGEGLAGAHPEFTAYVDALITARRTNPDRSDDLVTRLVETEIDGHRLTDVEIRTQLVFLIISGNETTRHLIGNLLGRVIADPDLFATLAADPTLLEQAVEESLRIDPPIHLLIRDCAAPTEMFGEPMTPGQKIVFGIASANRDEAVFDEADHFVLERAQRPRPHGVRGRPPHLPGGQPGPARGTGGAAGLPRAGRDRGLPRRLHLDQDARLLGERTARAPGQPARPLIERFNTRRRPTTGGSRR